MRYSVRSIMLTPIVGNYILAKNVYKLVLQLKNNKILVSTKEPIKIIEECNGQLFYKDVINNVLISSANNCKIIINDRIYENTS